MIRRIYLPAIAVVIATGLFSVPALAGHCPNDVKKITAAMATIGADKMSMARDAAGKGQALHEAGKHSESLKVLHEAMETLGIKH